MSLGMLKGETTGEIVMLIGDNRRDRYAKREDNRRDMNAMLKEETTGETEMLKGVGGKRQQAIEEC